MGSELLGNPAAGAEKGNVDSGKRILIQGFDDNFLTTVGELPSGGTRGSQEAQRGDGEIPALEHPDHLHANGTGRSDDGDMLG
jgi:hypothetical protein